MRYFCNAHRALLCLAGSRRPAGCCRTAGLPAGCAAFEPHSVIVTTANANSSIQLNAGDTLLVQLEGNSGTGYTWERIEPLAGALQSLGEPQFAPDKNVPGAPGHFTLRYATVPGSAQLELVYHRVWEADTPPVATFSLAVVVK